MTQENDLSIGSIFGKFGQDLSKERGKLAYFLLKIGPFQAGFRKTDVKPRGDDFLVTRMRSKNFEIRLECDRFVLLKPPSQTNRCLRRFVPLIKNKTNEDHNGRRFLHE
ncbi:hypothetical protein PbB2_02077 [Candidatus Phycosocius bacilliformis]|uniref:Uncharacterized protein n=1 Tax=Candidatus Phycosocius bacilliformis TaxID=1445552 RepID=A0A2P2EBF1_9PROT|nr:hypothetical protein PbB2_02077 [Candidatus Phycosocius bacilliformis]